MRTSVAPVFPVENAISYNESLNAYLIHPKLDSFRFVNVDELCDQKPFALWTDFKSNFSYIVLHHILL